jgi:hypothetical protein
MVLVYSTAKIKGFFKSLFYHGRQLTIIQQNYKIYRLLISPFICEGAK